MAWTRSILTVLTSKSLSHCSVVQILRSWTSKSVPNMQRGEFFLASRSLATAWCKLYGAQLQKVLRGCVFLMILTSRTALAPERGQPILRNSRFWELTLRASAATKRWKNCISRNSFPPNSFMSRICAVKHLCCRISILQDLAAAFSIVGN